MSPKLAKRRDELAWKHRDEVFEVNPNGYLVAPGLNEPDTHFSEGFDACHAEMLPMLEQMAEALDKASRQVVWYGKAADESSILFTYGYHIEHCQKALAAYQAWRDEP